jgi:hypothetical protein
VSKRSKNDVAEELIAHHFRVEPGMVEIYRLDDPDDAQAPIRLLEVCLHAVPMGKIMGFGFAASAEVPYTTIVAEITPGELDQLRATGFPEGWDLSAARVTRRSAA